MKKVLLKISAVMLTMVLIVTLLPFSVINAEEKPLYDYERDGSFRKIDEGNGFFRYYGPTGELDDDFSDASGVISDADDYYKSQNVRKKTSHHCHQTLFRKVWISARLSIFHLLVIRVVWALVRHFQGSLSDVI